MQVVIIGAGEVGFHTALRLSAEGHRVVVVDRAGQAIRSVNDQIDVQTLVGAGSSPAVLRDAGVDTADLVMAVTDSDEVNLQVCRFAKILAPSTTRVARIREAHYLDFIEEFGAASLDVDMPINPEREVARQIMQFLAVPAASSVDDFAEGRVKLLGLRVPPASPLVGIPLKDIQPAQGSPSLVAAVEREGEAIIPRGDDVLFGGDVAYVVVQDSAIAEIVSRFGLQSDPVKKLVVVGGGPIGSLVAEEARSCNMNVRLIEKDEARCARLADELKGVLILNGDGTDLNLLQEENVGAADVFAAVTDDEEDNVLVALLGRKMGAKRTIARVAHPGYVPLVSTLGLDLVVNTRFAAVGAILRYLRRGKVLGVTSLTDEGAEVFEAEALETSALVNRPLAQVELPPGAIVAAVIREGEVLIPSGGTVVLPGDHLVIFMLRKVLSKVEKLLTVSLDYF